jgi:hypothetical protein
MAGHMMVGCASRADVRGVRVLLIGDRELGSGRT